MSVWIEASRPQSSDELTGDVVCRKRSVIAGFPQLLGQVRHDSRLLFWSPFKMEIMKWTSAAVASKIGNYPLSRRNNQAATASAMLVSIPSRVIFE